MVDNATPPMTSSRPYLIRALYQWIVDNGLTPHLLVDASMPDVNVPSQHVSDGKIVLNVHPNSVRELSLENDWISFSARFSGAPYKVIFPVRATLAIYARENGQGMVFPEEGNGDDGGGPPSPPSSDTGGRKPSLRVVK
ncbi:Stringent starvation protein B [Nitrosococcus halophilus Nc 4]|uniref:Stringent starvation protein B n=2 Tax=Nitrosococcus halophilus TaxID=133539 RepID=D5C3G9_NITHN|nr:Stringent starvation protein B [Nitrosococcus halophilus Nc 4]